MRRSRRRARARAVGYFSAGTFEFLVGPKGLLLPRGEPRLQVEHPVTELVTGIDLVREQLASPRASGCGRGRAPRAAMRSSAGERGGPRGGLRSPPGPLTEFRPPLGPFVRVDTHVEDGTAVSPDYDSLLAKLAVWGHDREDRDHPGGWRSPSWRSRAFRTTRELALDIMHSEAFVTGSYSTSFLEEAADSLLALRPA